MGESTERLAELVALAKKKVFVPGYVKADPHGNPVSVKGHWKTVNVGGPTPSAPAAAKVAPPPAPSTEALSTSAAQSAVKASYSVMATTLPKWSGPPGNVSMAQHIEKTYAERVEALADPDLRVSLEWAIGRLNQFKKHPHESVSKSDKITYGRERGRLEDVLEMVDVAQGLTSPDLTTEELNGLEERLEALADRVGPEKMNKVHGKGAPFNLTRYWSEMKIHAADARLEREKIGLLPNGKLWSASTADEKREFAAGFVQYAGGLLDEEELERWKDFTFLHPLASSKHGYSDNLEKLKARAWDRVKISSALASAQGAINAKTVAKVAKAAEGPVVPTAETPAPTPPTPTPPAPSLGPGGLIDTAGLPDYMPPLVHNPENPQPWVLEWDAGEGQYKNAFTGGHFDVQDVQLNLNKSGGLEPLPPVYFEPGLSGGVTWAWDPEGGAYRDVSSKTFEAYNGYDQMQDKVGDGKIEVLPPPGMGHGYQDADDGEIWEWDGKLGAYDHPDGGQLSPQGLKKAEEKGDVALIDAPVLPSEPMAAPGGLAYKKPPAGLPESLVSTKTGAKLTWVPGEQHYESDGGATWDVDEVQNLLASGTVKSAPASEDPDTDPPYGGNMPAELVFTMNGESGGRYVLNEMGKYETWTEDEHGELEHNKEVSTMTLAEVAEHHSQALGVEGVEVDVVYPPDEEPEAEEGPTPGLTEMGLKTHYTATINGSVTEIDWDESDGVYVIVPEGGIPFIATKEELPDLLEEADPDALFVEGKYPIPAPKVPPTKETSAINAWLKDHDANYLGKMTAEDKGTWADLHAAGYHVGWFSLEMARAGKGKKGVPHKDETSNPVSPKTKQGRASLVALQEKMLATPEGRRVIAGAGKVNLGMGYEEKQAFLKSIGMDGNLYWYGKGTGTLTHLPTPAPGGDYTTYEKAALDFRFRNVVQNTRFDLMPPAQGAQAAEWDDTNLGKATLPNGEVAYLTGNDLAMAHKSGTSAAVFHGEHVLVHYQEGGEWKVGSHAKGTAVYESMLASAQKEPQNWDVTTAADPWKPSGTPEDVWKLVQAAEQDDAFAIVKTLAPSLHEAVAGNPLKQTSIMHELEKSIGPGLTPGQLMLFALSEKGRQTIPEHVGPDWVSPPKGLQAALEAVRASKMHVPPVLRRRASFSVPDGDPVKLEWRPGDKSYTAPGEDAWYVVRGSAWPSPGVIRITPAGALESGELAKDATLTSPSKVEAFVSPKTFDQVKAAIPGASAATWNTLTVVEEMSTADLNATFGGGGGDGVFKALNTAAKADGKPPVVAQAFIDTATEGPKKLMTSLLGTQVAESSADIQMLNWLATNGHWSSPGTLPEGIDWDAEWLALYAKGQTTPDAIFAWPGTSQYAAWSVTNAGEGAPQGAMYWNKTGAEILAQKIPEVLNGMSATDDLDALLGMDAAGIAPNTPAVAPAGPSWGAALDLTKTNKKLGGMHSKTVWSDQFDREWMSKGFPSDPNSKARVDAEHWAMEIGRLHGFRNPESRTMELEGQYSYVQHLAASVGDMTGVVAPWKELEEKSLVDAVSEHVNDWMVSNHDTHQENLLRHPDGYVYGIDKGQAFKFFGQDEEVLWSKSGGKVVAWFPAGNGARVWFDRVYGDVAAGNIEKEKLRRVTSAVLTRAKRASKGRDAAHREMLEEAFKNRTNFPKGMTREQFIDLAMERKAKTFDDFVAMWREVWKSGGYEWDIDEAKLGVGVLRNPKNEGEIAYSGVSGELLEAVNASKSKGVPTFFSGTDLEDSHMLLWEEVDAKTQKRILMGEGKLRADADAAVTKFLKGQDVTKDASVPSPSAAPPEPLPGNTEWSAKVVALAKTVNVHSPAGGKEPDGQYNQQTVNTAIGLREMLKGVVAKLEGEEGLSEKPITIGLPAPDNVHQQQAYLGAAKHYLAQLDQIFEAKENSTKTPVKSYAKFDYTPPPPNPVVNQWLGSYSKVQELEDGTAVLIPTDGSAIQTGTTAAQNSLTAAKSGKPGWEKVDEKTKQAAGKELKIVLTKAFREAGNFNPKTGVLTQTDGKVTKGNLGQEYDITYGDVEIEYRPWHGANVPKSQQGTMRFKIKNWEGDEGQLQDMFDVLSQMGVELSAAEETDLELFYWRHLNGILHSRKLTADHGAGKTQIDKFYASNPDPSPEEEIAALRAGFAAIHGEAKIAEADYFPKMQEVASDGSRGGKPHWIRPDAKSAREWLKEQKSQHFVAHAFYDLPAHWEMILGSGGLLATEERLRVLGQWVKGTSSDGDQGKGSSSFLFTNPGTTKQPSWGNGAGHVILSPALHNRTSNYAYNGDLWGEVDAKPKAAAYDVETMSNATQEMMVKNFISFASYMEVMVVSNTGLRNQIIARLKELGYEKIRGIPVEELVVGPSGKDTALKKARQRIMKTDAGDWKG